MQLDPLLQESTEFLVFWAVIVPLIGGASGAGALTVLAASFWLRHRGTLLDAKRFPA